MIKANHLSTMCSLVLPSCLGVSDPYYENAIASIQDALGCLDCMLPTLDSQKTVVSPGWWKKLLSLVFPIGYVMS